MQFTFRDKRISGLLVVVPKHEVRFEDELAAYNFPPENSRKLKAAIGVDRRRVVEGTTCGSDLACFGLKHLFDEGLLSPSEIDALIYVTETPDYFMPPTSNVIQGELGLGTDVWCMDINQGCAGFVVGLIQGFLMLEQPAIRKVVLVNADTLSRTCGPRDRSARPLIGDAASIAVLERGTGAGLIHADLRMDGSRRRAIMIPAGGFRMPKSAETAVEQLEADSNYRSPEQYHMDGLAVFNFVQTEIPAQVEALLAAAETAKEDVDWYMFHQPNRFMVDKLADRLGVPRAKVPSDIVEHYGNASSVTIPTAIVHALGDQPTRASYRMCLCGFGVGLTWCGMLLSMGPLAYCKMVEF